MTFTLHEWRHGSEVRSRHATLVEALRDAWGGFDSGETSPRKVTGENGREVVNHDGILEFVAEFDRWCERKGTDDDLVAWVTQRFGPGR